MPGGRPTDYDPEYHPAKAHEFCCEFAFTDLKLARLFDVSKATITNWKKEHPEFLASIRAGKDDYDSGLIEKSLARRARGFRYTETTKEISPLPDSETGETEMVITKQVKKLAPPDTKAIEFWLRNRKAKRWPDKHDLKLEGDLNINLIDSFAEEKEKDE